jgi:hemerythrin-like domain-containing protein
MADTFKLIQDDHRAVEELFVRYENIEEIAFDTKKEVASEIIKALRLHAEMEETILYPKLQDIFAADEEKMVEEAYAEHGVAKELMIEIESLLPEDPQFDAKIKVLNENVAHHIKEEEEELLARAEKELTEEQLSEIEREMEEFKEQI